jgi:hypothetical protein
MIHTTPEGFCMSLFRQAETVSVPNLSLSFKLDSAMCFASPDLSVVQNSTCMAQYFPKANPNRPPGGIAGLSLWRIVGLGLGVAGVGLACGAWIMYQKKPTNKKVLRMNFFKTSSDTSEGSSATDSEEIENEKPAQQVESAEPNSV